MTNSPISTINYQGMGWRCAVLRQRAGLDQKQAARKVGVSLSTWRRLERGQRCGTVAVLMVAQAFGVSIDWLVTGRPRVAA